MNVVAILSLRQIPNVAPYGASSILLWIIAAFCFFVPLGMVCGELATGWPKDGGIFVWVAEAFGPRVGWIVAFLFIICCVTFFPVMLSFFFVTIAYIIDPALADNKVFIGIASALMMWVLTWLNIKGMDWTKRINNWGAILGVFVPSIILVLLAVVWLVTGRPMMTDYTFTAANWLPDLAHWDTIVFCSSMMFAFAGLEVSAMIAGHTRNPGKDFPRAILISGIVIVAIYILGTISINVLFPASDANIVAGFMQAMGAAGEELGAPWLLPVVGICMGLGALGQVNSWMVGPIYMLNVAAKDGNILGKKISETNAAGAPAFALIIQAVITTMFCVMNFISPSVEAAYWTLTALTTLTYFVPYMLMFIAYYKLRKDQPDVHRAFMIPGKVLPIILPALGFISVLFAVILIFIPPAELDMGNIFVYESELAGGLIIGALVADILYKRAKKRQAAQPATAAKEE
ncbi:APC family permease [Rubeoparvulum massiliense]|uniref:APC family permease n=1 Tax=Rubeoparvulum massiliense TaxID=1631346 RepID=UPI0018CF1C87|nr:APC family permease [Rubeoparvulum massiliense]